LKNSKDIIATAKKTINIEAEAIKNLINLVDKGFEDTVRTILNSKGRVIVTGIGKSAIVGSKIVATFNSTGTPSIFMHAADAIHGDLGNILQDDLVICISKSGDTPEIKVLIPLIKNYGNKIAAITGNLKSYLAQNADFVLNTYVEKEACPNNLAPTSSTTAQLVIGDALAVCLLELNDFSSKDFAKYHPGGTLGKKLYLRVRDLVAKNEIPKVNKDSSIKDVIVEISEKRLGTTAVIENDRIVGIITDGDIRRMLEKNEDINMLCARDIMSENPITVIENEMAISALEIMKKNNITQILVTEKDKYIGVVHFHDLIKEGII